MPLHSIAALPLVSTLLLTGAAAWAQPLNPPGLHNRQAAAQPDILSPEQAFTLAAPALAAGKTGEKRLRLSWHIAPGYYLYRDQLRVSDAQGQSLALDIPEGQWLSDAFLGRVQVFHHSLEMQTALPQRAEQWPLQLQWQGCAEIGVCYPPQQTRITARQLGLRTEGRLPASSAEPERPANSATAADAAPLVAAAITPERLAPAMAWLTLPPSVLLGPVALPSMALVMFLALWGSQWWARRQQLRSGQPVEAVLLQSTLAGLIGARLAYVAQWWAEYWSGSTADHATAAQSAPASALLRMVDIRDGGWNLWAGLLAALLWALWRSRRQGVLRHASLQALAAGALLLIAGNAMRTSATNSNIALPSQPFVNAAAQRVDLRSLRGQPLVINLWASWCPPCKREMPVLIQAQKDHPGVHFLWINQGEQAAAVLRYLQTMPLPAEQVLLDPEQRASQHWQQRGLPSTYFYDASGQLKAMRMGELSRASLSEQLRLITSSRPAP